ncbi:MAG: hypothetical protein ACRC1H_07870, partial [Caldilineaceae bacterium]
ALEMAAALAHAAGAPTVAVRWQSEAADLRRPPADPGPPPEPLAILPPWAPVDDLPWRVVDPWPAIRLAGDAIWRGCGVQIEAGAIHLRPQWPADFSWWALVALPLPQGTLSLVWDGATLHSTLPIASAFAADGAPLPLALHRAIRTLHTDEDAFDLTFAFVDEAPAPGAPTPPIVGRFQPRFFAGG